MAGNAEQQTDTAVAGWIATSPQLAHFFATIELTTRAARSAVVCR